MNMKINYPLATEKVIRLMEKENKLAFIVDPNSTKREVKASLEKMFQVKIVAVATLRGSDGRKRAYVQFGKETPAIDIATRLGLL